MISELERARKLLPKPEKTELDLQATNQLVVKQVEELRGRISRIGQDIDEFSAAKKEVEGLIDTIANSVAITTQFKGYIDQLDSKLAQVIKTLQQSNPNADLEREVLLKLRNKLLQV